MRVFYLINIWMNINFSVAVEKKKARPNNKQTNNTNYEPCTLTANFFDSLTWWLFRMKIYNLEEYRTIYRIHRILRLFLHQIKHENNQSIDSDSIIVTVENVSHNQPSLPMADWTSNSCVVYNTIVWLFLVDIHSER